MGDSNEGRKALLAFARTDAERDVVWFRRKRDEAEEQALRAEAKIAEIDALVATL